MIVLTSNVRKYLGYAFFLIGVLLFILQMCYFFLNHSFRLEYAYSGLFYIINVLFFSSIGVGLLLLFPLKRNAKRTGIMLIIFLSLANIWLGYKESSKVKDIISFSSDLNVLLIKNNKETGESVYYRVSYLLFALPKERLTVPIGTDYKVHWLEDDVAAVTYKDNHNKIQQFIGTYGDRGDGAGYYNVGPSIYGTWKGVQSEVISKSDGITVKRDGKVQIFSWEQIKQYGTLAIVLSEDGQAEYTISLKESFNADQNQPKRESEQITLYQAEMGKDQAETLTFYKE
ncbi:hypothetical protein [Bacillus massilinigeriensis]|uniref:hypothetical protein n=1 Tax=Bacillus mediterraneensis TaxID=1805474 RepID=UPI0008F83CE4|nr:hypothetical protein [Bacillus mediterraneensis]